MILYTLLGISIDLILEKFNKDYPYSYIYIAYVFVYIGKYCYLKYMMDKLYYTYIEILIFLGSIGFIQKIFIFMDYHYMKIKIILIMEIIKIFLEIYQIIFVLLILLLFYSIKFFIS